MSLSSNPVQVIDVDYCQISDFSFTVLCHRVFRLVHKWLFFKSKIGLWSPSVTSKNIFYINTKSFVLPRLIHWFHIESTVVVTETDWCVIFRGTWWGRWGVLGTRRVSHHPLFLYGGVLNFPTTRLLFSFVYVLSRDGKETNGFSSRIWIFLFSITRRGKNSPSCFQLATSIETWE